jgi:nuclear receptor subfamily 2 group A
VNFKLHLLQETSARLLFMAVRWVRWLAPFQTLSRADQLLLLQESWKELFLLYLAQWSAPWDIDAVLTQRLARHRLTDDLLINTEVKTIQVTQIDLSSQPSIPHFLHQGFADWLS